MTSLLGEAKVKKTTASLGRRLFNTPGAMDASIDAYFAQGMASLDPSDFNAYCLLLVVQRREAELAKLIRFLDADTEYGAYAAVHYASHIYVTSPSTATKLIERATPILEKAIAERGMWQPAWMRGVSSFKRTGVLSSEIQVTSTCRSSTFIGRKPRHQDLMLIASCDERYFSNFAAPLMASFRQHYDGSHSAALLINLINPTPHAVSHLQRASAEANETSIYFSTSNGPHLRQYFASSRYYIAQTMLNEVAASVYIIDVDSMILARSFKEDLDRSVVAKHKSNCLPWQMMQGSRIGVRSDRLGKAFLSEVVRYIDAVFSSTKDQWFIDQNALEWARFRCFQKRRSSFGELRRSPLGRAIRSLTPAEKRACINSTPL